MQYLARRRVCHTCQASLAMCPVSSMSQVFCRHVQGIQSEIKSTFCSDCPRDAFRQTRAKHRVCHTCRASLATKPVSSLVTSVLWQGKRKSKCNRMLPCRQAVRPMSRGVPSARSAEWHNDVQGKSMSLSNRIFAGSSATILRMWLVESAK